MWYLHVKITIIRYYVYFQFGGLTQINLSLIVLKATRNRLVKLEVSQRLRAWPRQKFFVITTI